MQWEGHYVSLQTQSYEYMMEETQLLLKIKAVKERQASHVNLKVI